MDPTTVERANAQGPARTKAGALVFFVLAGALLVVSLLTSPPGQPGSNDGAPGTTASIR